MKSEDLLKYLEDEKNFTSIDPFKEYVTTISNEELFILLLGLDHIKDFDDPFMAAITRIGDMLGIVYNEYEERGLREFKYGYRLSRIGEEVLLGILDINGLKKAIDGLDKEVLKGVS